MLKVYVTGLIYFNGCEEDVKRLFAPDGTARQVGGDDLVDGKLPTNLIGVCVVFGTQRAVFIVDEAGIVRYRHVHALGLDYQRVDELRDALERVGTETPA